MKEDYQKALKKLTLFFLSNLVPFNRQSYQKQKGSGTSNQLLFRLQNKFKNIPLFVTYYLTKIDDVMWSSFWVISKFKSTNLCKPIHDINYSTSICPIESEKWVKEGKNLQKCGYLEKKNLFSWNKTFHSFKGLSFGEKNKNLIKNSRHKL